MTAPPAPKGKPPFLLVLGVGVAAVLGGTCICCIGWASQGKLRQERAAHVGSAARLIVLRDRLDRVYDAFPTEPVAAACTEPPPAAPVVVLAYSGLGAFRRGRGDGDLVDSDFHVTSTFLGGRHRPANDIDDDDAAAAVDSFGSPLSPLTGAHWVAVLRTVDQRHPAVTLDSFLGGSYRGWLVVFDLETGRPLCAQEVRAQNSATVGVGTFQGGADAAMADLVANLGTAKEQARVALSPALRLSF